MKSISISELLVPPVEDRRIEYVERKGIGHPDSLIDGIVDATSHALSRKYLESCDAILHHNVDKGLIIGGASKVGFGHGEITKKIEVIITGRAMDRFNNVKIDVDDIAVEVAREYLAEHTRFLDLDNEVKFESKIATGSADLTNLFVRGGSAPLANDTSFGIGFAPYTDTERLVLETERYLNSKEYKSQRPSVGEDIKVMGLRDGKDIVLTIAIAFVAQHVDSLDTYIKHKELVQKDVLKFAKKLIGKDITVHNNAADPTDSDEVYLTKSGLSAEAGDDGS
ncbi:MAG: methionine adenosyltransferase, partial [Candidatus Micrarchaeota archaeon]|nr:methionine adenosyltransferase [Candidatus Micrarchaeota archaeon]